MEQLAVKLFIIIKIRHGLLHFKLNLVTKEENDTKCTHCYPKCYSLSPFGVSHILPNIIGRFRGALDLNLFAEYLQLGIVDNLLRFPYVFVIFEGDEDATHW